MGHSALPLAGFGTTGLGGELSNKRQEEIKTEKKSGIFIYVGFSLCFPMNEWKKENFFAVIGGIETKILILHDLIYNFMYRIYSL